jgi:hypothetical protein
MADEFQSSTPETSFGVGTLLQQEKRTVSQFKYKVCEDYL